MAEVLHMHWQRVAVALLVLLLFPAGWFAKTWHDHEHRTTYEELYDFAFLSWRRMGSAFWELPLMPPGGRDPLETEIHQKFWSIPDGLVDWRYNEQAELFGKMCSYAHQYEEIVEHGSMLSSAGEPIANSGMFPSYYDRFALFTLVRLWKPTRIVEIGSGDSTKIAHAALSLNQHEGGPPARHQCIDPYRSNEISSERGISADPPDIIAKRLEALPVSFFLDLKAGEMLFIDSSHVVRPFGDVVFELVYLLPRLQSGVIVHIHDIGLPHYARTFLEVQHRHYTEQYMLACFLYGNVDWEVLWAGTAMGVHFAPPESKLFDKFSDKYDTWEAPDGSTLNRGWGGGSIYLRKK